MHWCAAANPAELLPHKRTTPLRMRRVPPKASTVLFLIRARARVATPQTLWHVSTQSHKRRAAAVVIDTEALVCSGSRCSSP